MVFTNAVVAIFVELSPVVGVTEVGVPVKAGELTSAFPLTLFARALNPLTATSLEFTEIVPAALPEVTARFTVSFVIVRGVPLTWTASSTFASAPEPIPESFSFSAVVKFSESDLFTYLLLSLARNCFPNN